MVDSLGPLIYSRLVKKPKSVAGTAGPRPAALSAHRSARLSR